jgi:multidrug resistance efflux pump
MFLPMLRSTRSITNQLQRATDTIFDGVGLRPLGIIVFTASVALLLYLSTLNTGTIRADAVATARMVDHPARVASFVTKVFVKPGDKVQIGAPLVELSSHFIDQRIQRIDVQIEQVLNEAQLAQAQLMVKEDRWLDPATRIRPDRPSLESPTEALYAKQLEVLQTRRRLMLEDRESLTVLSNFTGIVATVAWPGASIGEGNSVASVMPEFADEIVAFVAPATDPAAIALGARAFITRPSSKACRAAGSVLRRGAGVEQAPKQLRGLLRFPVHGMPVHISIPPDCSLGIGQVLTVEFERGVS